MSAAGRTMTDSAANADWATGRIDRASPIPYYYQLQELLKQEIDVGRWLPGELLPSEAQLAAYLGISRTVIRKALDVLESDGQVTRVKGKGTVVAPPKFRYEAVTAARNWFNHLTSYKPKVTRVLRSSLVPAGTYLGKVLQLSAETGVWEIVYISGIEDEPIALNQTYLRTDASAELGAWRDQNRLPHIEGGGPEFWDQLRLSSNLQLLSSAINVEQTVANEFEAMQLGIAQRTVVFLLSVLSVGLDERPVAFTRTVMRTDRVHFSVTVDHRPDKWDR